MILGDQAVVEKRLEAPVALAGVGPGGVESAAANGTLAVPQDRQ